MIDSMCERYCECDVVGGVLGYLESVFKMVLVVENVVCMMVLKGFA